MSNGKKIVICSIIILVVFGLGVLSGYFYSQARDNKRLAEYQQTIAGLGSKITELQTANNELAESNSRLKKTAAELRQQLDDIIIRIGEATGIISEIESGISGASDDVQRIIRSIGSLVKKVINLGNPE